MVEDPRTFTPKKAGEEIGCSSDTIRRYCGLYGRHLSEGATPQSGRPRLLTPEDVFILKVAKIQTELGLTIEEVDGFLDTVAIPEALVGEALEETGGQVDQVNQGEPTEALALMRQVATSLDRIADQGDRLERLEGELVNLRRILEKPPTLAPAPVEKKTGFEWSGGLTGFVMGVMVVLALVALVALVAYIVP